MKINKVIIPIVFLLLLTACALDENRDYIGTWQMITDNSISVTLSKDKTFILADNEGALSGTYEIKDGVIVFKVSDSTESKPVNENIKKGDTIECSIQLVDNVLNISYDKEVFKFTRK